MKSLWKENYTKTLLTFFIGDDQDLDDRVIKQLWEENQDLRDQVHQMKSDYPQADEGNRMFDLQLYSLFYKLADNFAKIGDGKNLLNALDDLEDLVFGPGAIHMKFSFSSCLLNKFALVFQPWQLFSEIE